MIKYNKNFYINKIIIVKSNMFRIMFKNYYK